MTKRRYAISIDFACATARGFYCAGRTAAEFGAFVSQNYVGLSAQRLRLAWDRLAVND